MTAIVWDMPGQRRFETGVDRGILFLSDGRAVPWNGITNIEDSTAMDSSSFYLDGVKYLERQLPGDFAATLTAFTYPDEFDEIIGTKQVAEGLFYHNQAPQMFNLCYRTRIGNDMFGPDYAYRLHILYNLMATPSSVAYAAMGDQTQPTEFAWTLSSTPPIPLGYRPTTHISINSIDTDPARLAAMEGLLYGTETSDPWLPGPDEFATIFETFDTLVITDNGDGTWTATDLTNSYLTMVSPTEFRIDDVDATYLDDVTYEVSTTNAP